MNREEANKLLSDFEVAAVALSWLGSRPPEEWEGIKGRYRKARGAVLCGLTAAPTTEAGK